MIAMVPGSPTTGITDRWNCRLTLTLTCHLMTSELLQQVRVLDPASNTDQVADVWIQDGIIRAMATRLTEVPADTQVYGHASAPDARSPLILAPGLVDLYSHSGQPGFESRETLESLLRAAAAGGFTRLALLPDMDPVLDHPAVLELLRSQVQSQVRSHDSPTQVYYWGALSQSGRGEQMTELTDLATAGVVGFADHQPLQNWMLLRRLLEYGKPLELPIALWCCNTNLRTNGVVREGAEALKLGLPGAPAIAETAPLAALLEMVETIGTPVHIMRISTARSVELIRSAKTKGLPITASTTWMHVLLNVTATQNYDPNLRLEPPLGNPEDQAALIQGLIDGVIDAIAIEHTPYTYEEKTVSFAEAPPGAIGLELALPLLWQGLVESGQCSALTLWRSLSQNPCHCLKQAPPSIKVGESAELTLFDPMMTWEVSAQTLNSHSANTPWLGKEVQGKIARVWGHGKSG
jgi:dihydroorotase